MSNRKIVYIAVLILFGILVYLLFTQLAPDRNGVIVASLIQCIAFVIFFFYFGWLNRRMLSLYSIFLLAFYLFQNGRVLMYALNIEYNYFYINKYGIDIVFQSVKFSTLCLVAAFAAGVFSFGRCKNPGFLKKLNHISVSFMKKLAIIMFILSSIVAFPYMVKKYCLCTANGYDAVIEYTASMSSFYVLMEKLFISFGLLLLIYSKKRDVWCIISYCMIIIWSILAVFAGDRTTGIAGLTIIALHSFYSSNWRYKKQGRRVLNSIILILAIVSITFLINIAFSYRMQTEYQQGSINDAVVGAVGTVGFSFFPLVLTMRICPSVEPFLYGRSMIGGLISGLIPKGLDFFGITSVFAEWSSEPTQWIVQHYDYSFGIDFSLISECYANFGWYGWIAMFFICAVIAFMLRNVDYSKSNNKFTQYTGLILLYAWFTLPRRKSFYVFNNIFWHVFVVGAIILLAYNVLNSKQTSYNQGLK